MAAVMRVTTKLPPPCPGPPPGNFGSGNASSRNPLNRDSDNGSSTVNVSVFSDFSAKIAPFSRTNSAIPAFDFAARGFAEAHFGESARLDSHFI